MATLHILTCLNCPLPDCVGEFHKGCPLIAAQSKKEIWNRSKQKAAARRRAERANQPRKQREKLPAEMLAVNQPGYKYRRKQQNKTDLLMWRGYHPEIHGPLEAA